MMYIVEYGGTLYGPFHSQQEAAGWRIAPSSEAQNMWSGAFKVREVLAPNAYASGQEQEVVVFPNGR